MKELEKIVQAVPRYIQSTLSQKNTVDDIRNDFHTAHPALKNPHFAPVISSVMQEVFAERKAQGLPLNWSPELREAIANRVYGIIPGLRAQVQTQAPQAPAAPAPSPIFTNGSRPPAQGAKTLSDDVINTFFTGRG
jgi:hypothetical protein